MKIKELAQPSLALKIQYNYFFFNVEESLGLVAQFASFFFSLKNKSNSLEILPNGINIFHKLLEDKKS